MMEAYSMSSATTATKRKVIEADLLVAQKGALDAVAKLK
jgi:hypothetical protein